MSTDLNLTQASENTGMRLHGRLKYLLHCHRATI